MKQNQNLYPPHEPNKKRRRRRRGRKASDMVCQGMSLMLPFDLVIEILARVPVKDLIRFRCVCKSWLLLFQDEKFITKHMTHAPVRLMSFSGSEFQLCHFFYETDKPETRLEMFDLNIGDKSLLPKDWVISHCRGLVCFDLNDGTFGIWNPALRDVRRIKLWHIRNWAEFGFGYDHSTQEYKIVLVPDMDQGSCSKAQVLFLTSGVSRLINFPSPENFVMCHRRFPGTLVGENIYWLVVYDNDLDLTETILRFDLVSETFNYFPGPPTRGQPFSVVLDVFKGCLCTVGAEQDHLGIREIVIWSAQHEVVNSGAVKSWSKIFRLSWSIVESLISPLVDHCPLVSALTYAGLLLFVAHFDGEAKLFAYNLEENSLREVDTNLSIDRCIFVEKYIETLVPIPGTSGRPRWTFPGTNGGLRWTFGVSPNTQIII